MQPKNRLFHLIVLVVLVVSLALSPAQPTSAQSDDGLKRDVNAETGRLSFIGSASAEPVSIMQSLGLPAADVAADPPCLLNPKRRMREIGFPVYSMGQQ